MPRKKTDEELKEALRKARARVSRLEEETAKRSRAEQARLNADIIKALAEWQDMLPEEERIPAEKMPGLFLEYGERKISLLGLVRSREGEAESLRAKVDYFLALYNGKYTTIDDYIAAVEGKLKPRRDGASKNNDDCQEGIVRHK